MQDTPRVYLIRHGETALNAAGKTRGWTNVPLDEHGVAEAHDMAEMLDGTGWLAIYASDLERAAETARIVAGPDAGAIQYTRDLRP